MALVRIRGGISPGLELARGEVMTVQHTNHVQNLINLGLVDVVELIADSEPQEPADAGLTADKGEEGTAEHGTTPPAPTAEE